jgi:LemA protein
MKKQLLELFIVTIFMSTFTSCGYNEMVNKGEAVKKQWANVESSYQRRSDLIGNLVNTVKGEANFEQKTLVDIANARANATKMTIDPSKATPEQLMQYQEAQGQFGQAIGRLLSISENYPNLKANSAFQDLRIQLEGTENRINTERNRYNEMVGDYNSYIKSIPQSFFAGSFGFTEKPYFQSDKEAAKAPKVQF